MFGKEGILRSARGRTRYLKRAGRCLTLRAPQKAFSKGGTKEAKDSRGQGAQGTKASATVSAPTTNDLKKKRTYSPSRFSHVDPLECMYDGRCRILCRRVSATTVRRHASGANARLYCKAPGSLLGSAVAGGPNSSVGDAIPLLLPEL